MRAFAERRQALEWAGVKASDANCPLPDSPRKEQLGNGRSTISARTGQRCRATGPIKNGRAA
jgi:hypothetical protein